MTIIFLVLALAVWLLAGIASTLTGRRSHIAGAGGAAAGCLLMSVPAAKVLHTGAAITLRMPWSLPYASFFLKLDPLAAYFLILLLGISLLAAVYGAEYMGTEKDSESGISSWFFFNGLIASMALVILAHNAVLFLMAWEAMSLTSFFLVTHEDKSPEVQKAGWIYLVAAHLGMAFLLAMFILLGRNAGTLDFDAFRAAGTPASIIFLLAAAGFGAKAGFMPFHVWLPEAHPAAPSHVSALMSGIMIKMGIYGLVRVCGFLGAPPLWWGYLFIGIGVVSGVWGVLLALAQHDLKRLLAYHSVENIGIIALGLGVWLLGVSLGSPVVAILGLAGAMLHVLNHAVFKSLLFLGAGAVARSAGTRDLDHLGGLLKPMPWTGSAFLIGAIAISGLPPLNGFISEFLIYLGAYYGIVHLPAGSSAALIAVIAALALIGGLAAACFAKAFGVVFLGEPRHEPGEPARESGAAMLLPMLILAACCIFIGLAAPWALAKFFPAVLAGTIRMPYGSLQANLLIALAPLKNVVILTSVFIALLAALAGFRLWLLSGRSVRTDDTWGCGYLRPSPRMQYTASSFAQPLVSLSHFLLHTRRAVKRPQGIFPRDAALSSETPDLWRENIYDLIFSRVEKVLSWFRWLQHGRVQLYILYVMVTLLGLFAGKFWR
jgi:formate hydrogenlyase subunit 3/multisubunit Na+/H+ antiporter MnhD subunit